jgi:hypothetical protein
LGSFYKAQPAAHIEIRVGGCDAVDDPKDKQYVALFLAGAHMLSKKKGNSAGHCYL